VTAKNQKSISITQPRKENKQFKYLKKIKIGLLEVGKFVFPLGLNARKND